MTCDTCGVPVDYAFYINNEFWHKVVGEDEFKNSVGRICAHCTLQALGGLEWWIIWNEPTERMRSNVQELDETMTSFLPLAMSRTGGGWQGVLADGERIVWGCEHYHVNARKSVGKLPPGISGTNYYAKHPEKRSARGCAVMEANRRRST